MPLAPLKAEIVFDRSALQRGIRQATRDTQRGTKSINRDLNTVSKTARRVGLAIGAIFAGRTIKSFLEAGQSIETIQLSLRGLLGDSAKAERAFRGIQRLAVDVTQGIDDLARGFQQLATANLESIENLEGLANVATLMDRSVGDAAAALRSLETETLRNTLGLNNVSTAAGNFTATLRNGRIIQRETRREFQLALIEAFRLEKGYKGVARGGASLFGSGITTIRNSVRDLSARLRDALAPAVQAIARDFFDASQRAGEWITQNKELISEKTLKGYERLKDSIEAIAKALGRIDAGKIGEGAAQAGLFTAGVALTGDIAGRTAGGAIAGRQLSQGVSRSIEDNFFELQRAQTRGRLADPEFLSTLSPREIQNLTEELDDFDTAAAVAASRTGKLTEQLKNSGGVLDDIVIAGSVLGAKLKVLLTGFLRFAKIGGVVVIGLQLAFELFQGLVEGIGNVTGALFGFDFDFGDFVTKLKQTLSLVLSIGNVLIQGVRSISNLVSATITALFQIIVVKIPDLFLQALDAIAGGVQRLLESLPFDVGATPAGAIQRFRNSFITNNRERLGSLDRDFSKRIKEDLGEASDRLSKAGKGVADRFNRLFGRTSADVPGKTPETPKDSPEKSTSTTPENDSPATRRDIDELNGLLERFLTPAERAQAQFRRDAADLFRLQDEGFISEERFDQEIDKASFRLREAGGAGKLLQFQTDLTKTTKESLTEGLAQGFVEAVQSGSFENFGQSLAQTVGNALLEAVARALAQAAVENTIQAGLSLANSLGSAFGGGSSNTTTGMWGGTVSPQGRILRMQTGGVVPNVSNRPFADSVPALLQPGERVLTRAENRQFERGGDGMNVSVNINTQSLDPSRAADVVAAQADVIERVIVGKIQNNSLIRAAMRGR